MKCIVAGSRSITSLYPVVLAIAASGFQITEIVSGGARGVDELGELYAQEKNIPVKRFPANWAVDGKSAGYIRNKEMANYADALVAVWDGHSKGTAHMIDTARMLGLKVYIKIVE